MNYILSHPGEVLQLTGQHLLLVAVSTGFATVIGIPLGIFLTRHPGWSRWILGAANVMQTIPSLALFGFLIPLPFLGGIGARTAIIALVLYALLPIIRNTHAGIVGVDPAVREAGRGMGMTDWQLLTQVELPLSLGVIMAGLRVATVISVGVATIAAAIGAGGLGMYIFRGVSMVDNQLILAGAVPSAILALLADCLLGLVERTFTKKPLMEARTVRVLALVIVLIAGAAVFAASVSGRKAKTIVIGSKNFTEQALLGELLAQQVERAGYPVERRFYLGGTLICHNALIAGQIDAYVEYTGTAYSAILKRDSTRDAAEVYRRLREAYLTGFGVELMDPLGFNNTFAVMVRGSEARRLHLKTIGQAAAHAPKWRAGFGNEFMEREDGYRGLAEAYGLRFAEPPRIMDLGLTYRALAEGRIDLIAGDATNGLIAALDLFVLEDDRQYFPPYQAVPFVRVDALKAHPGLRRAIGLLGGKISDHTMRRLNYAVDGEHQDAAVVAGKFLDSLYGR